MDGPDPTPATQTRRPDGLPGALQPRRPDEFGVLYDHAPPWDIGRPQGVFVELARAGALRGRVLDVGCGTGEHAMLAAGLGLVATGIDAVQSAIAAAEGKARERGLAARFIVWDVLRLPALGEQFDTVLDSGLFHVFGDGDRADFVDSIRAVVPTGGRYYMLCFSDRQPGEWGPRRVSQDEIRAYFAEGWRVESIDEVRFEVTRDPAGALAWLAAITRT